MSLGEGNEREDRPSEMVPSDSPKRAESQSPEEPTKLMGSEPSRDRPTRSWLWPALGYLLLGLITLTACLLAFVIGAVIGASGSIDVAMPGEKIAYMELTGPIVSSRERGNTASLIVSDEVVPFIGKALKDDDIKGMLVVVNSPGGSATASHEIYSALMRFRERKPIVVYIRDIAASGGYYISCAGSYIVASPNSVVGNIGAIMINLNIREMLDKLGIKPVVIKSSEHKDLLSSFREPTPEERQLLESVLKDVYDEFKRAILEGRKDKLTPEELEEIADGRILSGRSALRYKLVDAVGTLKDAEDKLKELIGMPKDKELKRVTFRPKRGKLSELFDLFPSLPPETYLYRQPSVMYR